jgi:hypothetical protein
MLYILYHAVTAEKEYLGQSKRQFGTRLKEHEKTVSTLNKGKSVLAEHVCDTKLSKRWVLITIQLGFVFIYINMSSERKHD